MALTDLSNYTTVFRAQPVATSTSAATEKQRRVIKRNRQPVSCTTCRLRKLKCDRLRPCGSCVKRGDEAACEFVARNDGGNNTNHVNGNGVSGSSANSRRHHEEKSRSEAQVRLQRLEEMVNGLIHVGAPAGPDSNGTAPPMGASVNTAPSRSNFNGQITETQNVPAHVSSPTVTPCAGATTGGHLSRNGEQTSYIGATHWAAILESIHDIQEYLDSDNDEFLTDSSPETSASPSSHVDFVFGSMEPLTLTDALAALPSRSSTDALLAVYFNSKFTCVPFLHSGKFQREYEVFLEDPTSASLLWLSILFSTLSIGTKIASSRGYPVAPEREGCDPLEFMTKAAQCLVSGQYHKGQPYALEALLLYANCKHVQNPDLDPTLWSLFGLATRMAQRMGYHRDPRRLGASVSPFESEIRRRLWFFVESFDLLLSFQLGMPPIVHEEECDTESPGNFLDEDFDEANNSLPIPRSESEATSALYFRHKSRVIRLQRLVIRHALSTKQPVYEKTVKLDQDLHALHAELPACLRNRTIRSSSFTDQTYTIMHRLMLELLHLKCVCVLHRTYLSYEKDNPQFDFSRETCRTAALKILDMQVEFDQEITPGGRLYDDRWMLSSFALHDFLLAAMIICLDLVESSLQSDRQKELAALRTSYDIWLRRRHLGRDCAHASRVLAAMLKKVSGQPPQSVPENPIPSPPPSTEQAGSAKSNFSEGYPMGLSPHDGFFQGEDKQMQDSMLDFVDFEPLDTVLSDTENLDWNLIDQYLRINNKGDDTFPPGN